MKYKSYCILKFASWFKLSAYSLVSDSFGKELKRCKTMYGKFEILKFSRDSIFGKCSRLLSLYRHWLDWCGCIYRNLTLPELAIPLWSQYITRKPVRSKMGANNIPYVEIHLKEQLRFQKVAVWLRFNTQTNQIC